MFSEQVLQDLDRLFLVLASIEKTSNQNFLDITLPDSFAVMFLNQLNHDVTIKEF